MSIEAFYKKLLVAEKESKGKKLTKKEKDNLGVDSREVKRVLSYFNIKYDDGLVERIFGQCDDNYMECSIKKLRNRMVHNVNENVLRVILERYDRLISDIEEFEALFL